MNGMERLKMSYGFYLLLCLVFLGCSDGTYIEQEERFNRMKPPVVLFGKTESTFCTGCWATTLKDGDGNLHQFGDAKHFSQGIGSHYSVGDTLKK